MPDIGEGFVFADEAEAQAACEWWQKELNVPQWRIKVTFNRWRDFDNSNSAAQLGYNESHEIAWLKLLDPVDSWQCNPGEIPLDHEYNLVHELLHLVYVDAFPELETDKERQATNRNACAFIHLRRLAYPKPPWRGK